MIPHVFCDWTTLRATSATSELLQSESRWLELYGFRDLTAWIHVGEATSAAQVSLELQTSPTRDAALFQTLSTTPVGAGGVFVARSRARAVAPTEAPLATVLRWRVTRANATAWSVTFRVILALNPVARGAAILAAAHGREEPSPCERVPAGAERVRDLLAAGTQPAGWRR